MSSTGTPNPDQPQDGEPELSYDKVVGSKPGSVNPFGDGPVPSDHVASRIQNGTRYDGSSFSEPDSTSADAFDEVFGKKEGPGLFGETSTELTDAPDIHYAGDDQYRRPRRKGKLALRVLAAFTTIMLAALGWIANDAFEVEGYEIPNIFEWLNGNSSTDDSLPESDSYMNPVYIDPSTLDSYVPWDEQCGSDGIATDSGIGVYLDERGWGGCQAYNPLDSGWPSADAEGVLLGCWAPDRDNAIANAAAGKVFGEDFEPHQWGADHEWPEPYCVLVDAASQM